MPGPKSRRAGGGRSATVGPVSLGIRPGQLAGIGWPGDDV